LQRLAWRRPELVRGPLVLHGTGRRGAVVVGCSRSAAEAGVTAGLPLAEARTLLERRSSGGPAAFVAEDPRAARDDLRTLADWHRRFTPLVGLEEGDRPECLLLDVTGCGPLCGDEAGLLRRLGHDLRELGLHPRIAVAETVGAAWAVARCAPRDTCVPAEETDAALAPLPVAALRLPGSALRTLDELRVTTVARLLRLPRAEWAPRFGTIVAERVDQAFGRRPEPLTVERPREMPVAREDCEPPIGDRLLLERLLRRRLEPLVRDVADRGEGLLRLDVALRHAGSRPTEFAVELLRPAVEAEHLDELLRLRLERLRIEAEIVGVELRAAVTAPRRSRLRELFPDPQRAAADELAALCERLTGRLGRDAVLRPIVTEEPEPEAAGRLVPLSEAVDSSSRGSAFAATDDEEDSWRERFARAELRPLRLLHDPPAVQVAPSVPDGAPRRVTWAGGTHAVVRTWGPERIVSGWWCARSVVRDYWRVELETGQWLWLFRGTPDDVWRLHGTFD
jgi:protein ImuB